jgi:hypothetical protein
LKTAAPRKTRSCIRICSGAVATVETLVRGYCGGPG